MYWSYVWIEWIINQTLFKVRQLKFLFYLTKLNFFNFVKNYTLTVWLMTTLKKMNAIQLVSNI